MVAMNLWAAQLQNPNRELLQDEENIKFIHIGCRLLNIANKSGVRDEISQNRFNRIADACRMWNVSRDM